ncbi:inner core [Wallal virus]|uniref:Inner core n=1 Tax=Wallal virus TaxID=40061 RepID=U3RAA6_9REOV|nr:inner core [Wallal virus]AGX00989.1 inner core [Wallal virus]
MTEPAEAKPLPRTAPYLVGEQVSTDDGPLLSLFALQEIMQKVRQNQAEYLAAARETDLSTPDVQKIIDGIKALIEIKFYRIEKKPPESFRHIVMQSYENFLRVDTYYERMSEIGETIDEEDPIKTYTTVLAKIRYLRDQGAFILHDVDTKDLRGMEIADPEILGVNIKDVMRVMTAEDRFMVQSVLDGSIIENGNVGDRDVDVYTGAMSDVIYRIYNRLQGYIEGVQLQELRNSIDWLARLGRRKKIAYERDFLTDFRRRDTIWIQTMTLPINVNVIWSVPRCGIANLIMNIATCVPTGEYVMANPRITSITLTQRITTTGPFSLMAGTTPTAMQMGDVRKIYLSLMFPGQIILDIKNDPAQRSDPTMRMVAGVVGHLMFTYGRRFTNITTNMAQQLDIALNDFLLYMYNARIPVTYGQTGLPLDFRIGRIQYDCNQFRANAQTGTGYNGWAVNDVELRDPSPYDHVQRFIRYCDIDSREIIEPTTFGVNMQYHVYNEMMRMLVAAGKDQEAAYFRAMLPFHMVRFARLNQIINEDLLCAFSMPDDQFNALLPNLVQGIHDRTDPIVLEVSWISIWHAFNRSFDPTNRSELLPMVPLLESIYASQLSVMKIDMRNLALLQRRFPDSLLSARPSHFWRVVLDNSPEAIRSLMDLSHSFSFVNVRDIMEWVNEPSLQDSLQLTLEREAWAIANDFEELMLISDVYMHRDMLPEPRLDDIKLFRREGFYYTNMLEGPPRIDQVVEYTYEVARLQANLGHFKSALRRIMDDNGWVRFQGALRSVKVKFYDARPPEEILSQIPYEYNVAEKGGLFYASIKYAKEATIYYLIYNVEYSNTPDHLILINPTYTMTKIYMGKRIVERVRPGQLLAVLNKRMIAYKGKMRIMDITGALKVGTRLAAPT